MIMWNMKIRLATGTWGIFVGKDLNNDNYHIKHIMEIEDKTCCTITNYHDYIIA